MAVPQASKDWIAGRETHTVQEGIQNRARLGPVLHSILLSFLTAQGGCHLSVSVHLPPPFSGDTCFLIFPPDSQGEEDGQRLQLLNTTVRLDIYYLTEIRSSHFTRGETEAHTASKLQS